MKNSIFLSILLISISLLSFVLISSKNSKDEVVQQQSFVSSHTVSVPIPDYVDFCGERISLSRLDMRERFDREINTFTYSHSSTLLYIKRANRFFPIIEPILKKNGIPDDFKYLCVIESGLETRALSPAKAAGLWQFMPDTGKSYNLEVRDGVDERYHVAKSTEAACKYLKDAYKRFGDWANAAASYNAGMGRISGQLNQQYVESAFDLHLVSETSRYVFRIIAIKQIFMNPQRYGFILKPENLYPAIEYDYVEVSEDIPDLADFAKKYGVNFMTLKDHNVWLRDTKLTIPKNSSKTYQIAIPKKEYQYYDRQKVRVHDTRWIVN